MSARPRIEIVAFEENHLDAIAHFAARVWQRPDHPDYLRWRYLESRPFYHLRWARRGDECLAMVSAIERPYRCGSETRRFLETFDWYCLPDLRRSGVGIRVMRALMQEPLGIFSVGGTSDTLTLIPRLGWQEVAQARAYTLLLDATELLQRSPLALPVPARAAEAGLRIANRVQFGAIRRVGPRRGTVRAVDAIDHHVLGLYEGAPGTVAMPDPDFVRWLRATPPAYGHYQARVFEVGERSRGWSLARVYPTPSGPCASLVTVFAPGGDARMYAWMVAETVRALLPHRPTRVYARTSNHTLARALTACRFISRSTVPISMWPGGGPVPPRPFDFCRSESDAAFLSGASAA